MLLCYKRFIPNLQPIHLNLTKIHKHRNLHSVAIYILIPFTQLPTTFPNTYSVYNRAVLFESPTNRREQAVYRFDRQQVKTTYPYSYREINIFIPYDMHSYSSADSLSNYLSPTILVKALFGLIKCLRHSIRNSYRFLSLDFFLQQYISYLLYNMQKFNWFTHYRFITFVHYAKNNPISDYLKLTFHIVGPPLKSMLPEIISWFTFHKKVFYCIRICTVITYIIRFNFPVFKFMVACNYSMCYFILKILYHCIRGHDKLCSTFLL